MISKRFFAQTALLLSIVIASPCRLSSGIVLMLFFNCMIAIGCAANYAVCRLKLFKLLVPLMIYSTVFFTVLFKQFTIMLSPALALSTGFALYVTGFCAYESGQYFLIPLESFAITVSKKLKESLKFSALALAVFLFREAFGLSAVSFPAPQGVVPLGMIEIRLPRFELFDSLVFIASIPGAVIVTTIAITLCSALRGILGSAPRHKTKNVAAQKIEEKR
jgi:hypothetical protein